MVELPMVTRVVRLLRNDMLAPYETVSILFFCSAVLDYSPLYAVLKHVVIFPLLEAAYMQSDIRSVATLTSIHTRATKFHPHAR